MLRARQSPPAILVSPGARLRVRQGACLTERFPELACRHCADACPTRALSATRHGPRLAAGCVECGQCAVACPTEALSVPGYADLGTGGWRGVDCWRVQPVDSPSGAVRVPCLGGLRAVTLVEWTLAGQGRPVALLDRGFCGRCPAGGGDHLDGHPAGRVLAEVQDLLAEIGTEPSRWPRRMRLPLPAARMVDGLGLPLMETRLSRRAWLTARPVQAMAAASIADPVPAPSQPGSARRRLLDALQALALPERSLPARLFPQVAASGRCSDHRVCAGVCPTGALSGDQDETQRGLRFDPAACIACGLCVRHCPEQALTLSTQETGPPAMGPRELTRHVRRTCPVCGAEHVASAVICPTCRRDRDLARSACRSLFGATA